RLYDHTSDMEPLQRLKRGWLFPAHRQADFKAGLAGAGFKFNFTAMTVADDAVTDDQSQTGTGADAFGGEKWLEDARLEVRRNASTVVHDLDDQLIVFQESADANLTGTIDRIDRIINQIGPDLIEFASISHDARHRPIKC